MMALFMAALAVSILDAQFADTDYIAWSVNGTSESANLARTAIKPSATGWSAAVSGTPSTKNNGASLTTAGNSAGGNITVTHAAIYSASSGGTQKTPWTA